MLLYGIEKLPKVWDNTAQLLCNTVSSLLDINNRWAFYVTTHLMSQGNSIIFFNWMYMANTQRWNKLWFSYPQEVTVPAFLSVFQLKIPKLKVDVNRHKDGIANGKQDLGAKIRFFTLAQTHMWCWASLYTPAADISTTNLKICSQNPPCYQNCICLSKAITVLTQHLTMGNLRTKVSR